MVRAKYLTPEHLIKALKRGDFYASSGVVLEDVNYSAADKTLSLQIHANPKEKFTTEFIATIRSQDASQLPTQIGEVVATSSSLTPKYKFKGNELYVRARVTSDQPVNDPAFENQTRQAWTQPVGYAAE